MGMARRPTGGMGPATSDGSRWSYLRGKSNASDDDQRVRGARMKWRPGCPRRPSSCLLRRPRSAPRRTRRWCCLNCLCRPVSTASARASHPPDPLPLASVDDPRHSGPVSLPGPLQNPTGLLCDGREIDSLPQKITSPLSGSSQRNVDFPWLMTMPPTEPRGTIIAQDRNVPCACRIRRRAKSLERAACRACVATHNGCGSRRSRDPAWSLMGPPGLEPGTYRL